MLKSLNSKLEDLHRRIDRQKRLTASPRIPGGACGSQALFGGSPKSFDGRPYFMGRAASPAFKNRMKIRRLFLNVSRRFPCNNHDIFKRHKKFTKYLLYLFNVGLICGRSGGNRRASRSFDPALAIFLSTPNSQRESLFPRLSDPPANDGKAIAATAAVGRARYERYPRMGYKLDPILKGSQPSSR